MVREQLEETLVLVQKPAVDDLPALAQSVGTGVDQRFVFQVLVLMSGNGIYRQEWTADRAAALGHDLLRVQQVWPRRLWKVMEQAIGPERGVVGVPFTQ